MKTIFLNSFFSIAFTCICLLSQAQDNKNFSHWNKSNQQASIDKLLENYIDKHKVNPHAQGFRIQIYYNNDLQNSRKETEELSAQLLQTFPDIGVYTTYESPFWRLTMGDCRTYAEAKKLALKVGKQFPELAKQIIILKDQDIKLVPLHTTTSPNSNE